MLKIIKNRQKNKQVYFMIQNTTTVSNYLYQGNRTAEIQE